MVKKLLTLYLTIMITFLCMIATAQTEYVDEGVLMPFDEAQPALLGSAVYQTTDTKTAATVTNADGIRSAALTGQTGFTIDKAICITRQPVRGGAIVSWASTGLS